MAIDEEQLEQKLLDIMVHVSESLDPEAGKELAMGLFKENAEILLPEYFIKTKTRDGIKITIHGEEPYKLFIQAIKSNDYKLGQPK